MDTLTDVPIPAALGAGYRAPGFDPYITFLRESVFLKFNTRAYKNQAEKVTNWKLFLIIALTLKEKSKQKAGKWCGNAEKNHYTSLLYFIVLTETYFTTQFFYIKGRTLDFIYYKSATINVIKLMQMSLMQPQRLCMLNLNVSFRIMRGLNCSKYLILARQTCWRYTLIGIIYLIVGGRSRCAEHLH